MTTIERGMGVWLLAACCAMARAAPTLPQVAAGQAAFAYQGGVFSITNTPGTIINWREFSIAAGETTRFIQQDGNSAVLNRVLGQDPSRILGALQSNGKVYLINPNGILFGEGARVDVNGLVASSLALSDADFLAGKGRFGAGTSTGTGTDAGAVRNHGSIATPAGGRVLLIGPQVENGGIIRAPGGEVLLAAGRSVQLADAADPDLHVVVSAPADSALNLGRVLAQGGRIGVLGALVGQRGVLDADSALRGADGRIVLKASRAAVLGAASVTSAASVAGEAGSGRGGEIRVLGERIDIEGAAVLDASGAGGGGAVLVGGDYRGGGGLPHAQELTLAPGAAIRADALGAGDGGKVVLWSDGATEAHGSISARGAGGGSGGLVETSGRTLDVDGLRVAAAGAGGARGSWLLDPYDIEVTAGGTAPAGGVASASAGAAGGVTRVAPATLTAAGADVILDAKHDIVVSDALDAVGSVRASAGNDLRIDAAVSAGGDLDLRAGAAFVLGAGGALASGNYIDIQANRVVLDGRIGGRGGQLPVLSFTSTDPGLPLVVGSGNADPNALWLDAGRLGALSANLYELNLGNSRHTGALTLGAPLALSSLLVLDNSGAIRIAAPLGVRNGLFATVHDGSGGLDVGAAVDAGGTVALDAGAGTLAIRAPLAAGALRLAAGTGIVESGAGTLKAATLALRGGRVALGGANAIGTLAAVTSADLFQVTNAGSLRIGSVDGLAGIDAANAALQLDAAGIGGDGILQAASVTLRSSAGIGSAAVPLQTRSARLAAYNSGWGSAAIVIANVGKLELANALQEGAGNGGAIAIDNVGELTVPVYRDGVGEVRTAGGDIRLAAHSPLTIAGRVGTDSGNIDLLADNGGLLTVAAGARVASASGDVRVGAGAIAIAPGTIVVASPGKLHLPAGMQIDPGPQQQAAPSLAYCAAHPDDAVCLIARGSGGDPRAAPVAQALQDTVQLANTGAAGVAGLGGAPAGAQDDGGGAVGTRTAGPVQAQASGARNDEPAKNYCN